MPALPLTTIRPTHSLERALNWLVALFLAPLVTRLITLSSLFSRSRHYITYVACRERRFKGYLHKLLSRISVYSVLSWSSSTLSCDHVLRFSSINIFRNIIKRLVVNIIVRANILNILLYLILICYFYDTIVTFSRRYVYAMQHKLCSRDENTL